MTIKEFIEKHEICVNAPAYLGAPYPPFADDEINEEAFPHELRFKNIYINAIPNENCIELNWETQSWNENITDFISEIKRYYNYLFKKNKVETDEKLTIKIHLYDRDGKNKINTTIEI